jgi:hypothetical protein
MASPYTALRQRPPTQDELLAQQLGLTPEQLAGIQPADATGMPAQPDPTQDRAPSAAQALPQAQGLPNLVIKKPVVPAVAAGSGLTNKVENTGTQKVDQKSVQATLLDPETFAGGVQRITGLPEFQDQKAGINRLQDLLAMEAGQAPQMDYSPLLSLVDAQTGSQFQRGYKAPDNQANLQRVSAFASKIQDDRRDLLKTIMTGLSAQKAGTNIIDASTLQKLGITSTAADPEQKAKGNTATIPLRQDTMVQNKIDKAMEPVGQRVEQLSTLFGALKSNDYGQIMPALSIVAKEVGADKGMLSEGDINRTLTRTIGMDWAKFQAYISDHPGEAKVNPLVTQSIRELTAQAFKNGVDRYTTVLKREKASLQASAFNSPRLQGMFQAAEAQMEQMRALQKEMSDFNAASPKNDAEAKAAQGSGAAAKIEQMRKENEEIKKVLDAAKKGQ